MKELCSKIRRESGKAGLALASNLKMGFFTPLSVSLQAILARIDFLLEKATISTKKVEEAKKESAV